MIRGTAPDRRPVTRSGRARDASPSELRARDAVDPDDPIPSVSTPFDVSDGGPAGARPRTAYVPVYARLAARDAGARALPETPPTSLGRNSTNTSRFDPSEAGEDRDGEAAEAIDPAELGEGEGEGEAEVMPGSDDEKGFDEGREASEEGNSEGPALDLTVVGSAIGPARLPAPRAGSAGRRGSGSGSGGVGSPDAPVAEDEGDGILEAFSEMQPLPAVAVPLMRLP